jgi:transcriptional regulator with XRE-family HTH domain
VPAPEGIVSVPTVMHRIAQRRKELGISQAEMARRCATSRAAIRSYEKGLAAPGLTVLLRMSEAVECQLTISPIPRS